jgi:hypothetical protein
MRLPQFFAGPTALRISGVVLLAVHLGFAGGLPTEHSSNVPCAYPCWSQVAPSVFSEDQYAYSAAKTVGGTLYTTTMALPTPPQSPFIWDVPYPDVPSFVGQGSFGEPDDTGCTYGDTYVSGIPGAPALPMQVTGHSSSALISRDNPTYIYRTSELADVRGIGVQGSFQGTGTGGAGGMANGNVLTQSVFYHSQRCYTATTEFGFARTVGAPSGDVGPNTLLFYYSIYTNCPDNCLINNVLETQIGGYSLKLSSPMVTQVSIPIPQTLNSAGRTDWLYEAWLVESGGNYTWNIVVLDPVDYAQQGSKITLGPVQSWFVQYANQMLNNGGLNGYMTITSNLSAQWSPVPNPDYSVSLRVVNLFAP